MNIKKLSNDAVIPNKGSQFSAGYDLYSIEEYELKPLERKPFKTGIAMAIPHGFYGRIAPRSGLAVKKGIDVMAGVIDEDYRGELCVVLINLGSENIKISKGDKIAQIIFENYKDFGTLVESDTLTDTDRGINGFGSTDVKKNESISTDNILEIFKKKEYEVSIQKPTETYSDIVKNREKNISSK